MKFFTIGTFALLLAGAQAAPVSENPALVFNKRKEVNDCGTSTFINQSSTGSPEVADCRIIASNIKSGGTWTTTSSVARKLVSYGTCALDVSGSDFDLYYKVGNEDIINIINDSITKFKWKGKVGAKGVMKCGGASVTWNIYRV
ncbi:hypothetical protein N7454_006450 [Penicillium verhagenii]|nr:hypothetical protein N7454_006450 [Penicillium verhagenii]